MSSLYVAPASTIDSNPGTSLKSNAPLNDIICSPSFNGFNKIQKPSDTPVPVPGGIATGLPSTAVKVKPPKGESILYCSRFLTLNPSMFTCKPNALSAKLLAHILWAVSFAPKNGVFTSRVSHITLTIGNRIDVPAGIPHSCSGKSPVAGSLSEPTRNKNLPLSCKPTSHPA